MSAAVKTYQIDIITAEKRHGYQQQQQQRAAIVSMTTARLAATPTSPTVPVYLAPPKIFRTSTTIQLTSHPIDMASVKVSAPVGRIMNSWKASLLPACSPPLMTLKEGTGSTSWTGVIDDG